MGHFIFKEIQKYVRFHQFNNGMLRFIVHAIYCGSKSCMLKFVVQYDNKALADGRSSISASPRMLISPITKSTSNAQKWRLHVWEGDGKY